MPLIADTCITPVVPNTSDRVLLLLLAKMPALKVRSVRSSVPCVKVKILAVSRVRLSTNSSVPAPVLKTRKGKVNPLLVIV